jgi:transcriptional regulator with XRE-family HTH domain
MNIHSEKNSKASGQKDTSTKDIAKATGIPQSHYVEMEHGVRIPTDGQIERLESFFALPEGELASLVTG